MPVKARQGGTGRVRGGRPGAQQGGGSSPGSPTGDSGPSFTADFTAISSLPTGISFSRASGGNRFNSSGVNVTEAIDAPRFDYSWNGSAWVAAGLLIEEQRTNLYLQSGSPANQTIAVASGTTYTVSFYETGTLTLSGAATQTMNGTGTNVRTSYTFTAATTSLVIAVSGTVIYPNVEAGPFATSYIPTTSAAVTRSADVAQLAGSALAAFQGAASSVIMEVDGVPTAYGTILNDPTGGVTLLLRNGSSATQLFTQANSVTVVASVADTQAIFRVGLSRDSGGVSLVGDGGTVATDATAALSLAGANIQIAGRVSDGSYLNKHVRSIAIYSSRLSDASLQTKSVVGAAF